MLVALTVQLFCPLGNLSAIFRISVHTVVPPTGEGLHPVFHLDGPNMMMSLLCLTAAAQPGECQHHRQMASGPFWTSDIQGDAGCYKQRCITCGFKYPTISLETDQSGGRTRAIGETLLPC